MAKNETEKTIKDMTSAELTDYLNKQKDEIQQIRKARKNAIARERRAEAARQKAAELEALEREKSELYEWAKNRLLRNGGTVLDWFRNESEKTDTPPADSEGD